VIGLSVAAKPEFGSCQTRVWQLSNPSLAVAKPKFGSCQTRVWQLPNQTVAATEPDFGGCPAAMPNKPEFGNCQTPILADAPLPSPSLAAVKPECGSRQTRVWQMPNQS